MGPRNPAQVAQDQRVALVYLSWAVVNFLALASFLFRTRGWGGWLLAGTQAVNLVWVGWVFVQTVFVMGDTDQAAFAWLSLVPIVVLALQFVLWRRFDRRRVNPSRGT